MRAILKFDFQKKKTITFFWSKLSKLHKKDPILHVATSFSLKQGETRTSHGPIPHPLTRTLTNKPNASHTALWLVAIYCSAVAEWFDRAWLQKFVNALAPPTLQTFW